MAKVEFEDKTDIPSYEVNLPLEELVEAVQKHFGRAPDVFNYGDQLVKVIVRPETGELTIMPLPHELVQVYSPPYIRFHRMKKDGPSRVDMPADVAKRYVQARQESLHPTLGGISYSPIIDRKSGAIISKRAYDVRSKLFVDSPEIEVPARPTRSEALAALAVLRHTYRTLPYGDSERTKDDEGNDCVAGDMGFDESSFLIGGVMTAVARASLPLAPMLVIDAPIGSGSGVGKGLATHSCSMLAQGKKAFVMTFGDSQEEFEKRLAATAITGTPTLMLDNFNSRHLGGSNLNSLITESPSRIRLLGSSTIAEIPQRMWIAANGTGIRVREDLARRVVFVRLDSHVENPEERRYSFNLLRDIYERRTELLEAAFTILRWGILEDVGKGVEMGSFEAWARLVRDPMVALGCQDPAKLRGMIRQQDPEREMWAEVFELWWQLHGDKRVVISDAQQKGFTMMHPQLRSMLQDILAPKAERDSAIAKRNIGKALSLRHHMILAGWQLIFTPRKHGKDHATFNLRSLAAR